MVIEASPNTIGYLAHWEREDCVIDRQVRSSDQSRRIFRARFHAKLAIKVVPDPIYHQELLGIVGI